MTEPNDTTNQQPPTSSQDIRIYARIDQLRYRLDAAIFADISDPLVAPTIERTGSLDLNIALYDRTTGTVRELDSVGLKMAEEIAADSMFVCVVRSMPRHIVDVDGLAADCSRRVQQLREVYFDHPPPFKGAWYIVEMMGKKRFSAFVSEVSLAGQRMLKFEIPIDKTGVERTVKYVGSRNAIYALTACDESFALKVAGANTPIPYDRWELQNLEEDDDITKEHRGGAFHMNDETPADSVESEPNSSNDPDNIQF